LIYLYHQNTYGCTVCENDYVGIHIKDNSYGCVTDSSEITSFPFCKNFGI